MKNWKLVLVIGAVSGCMDDQTGTEEQAVASRYIVACSSALPADFSSKAMGRGDTLHHLYPDAGFAVVSTTKPSALGSGSCTVVQDVTATWIEPMQARAVPSAAANPPNTNDDDFFFDAQWGHDAVNAPEAWAAGRTGRGVRVAVLDTGFDLANPDLAPNINYALSRDFTGEGLNWTRTNDPFSHGTHTAGTIAAADNAIGTIGVAPNAELVLVKVLFDEGFGSFGDILAGMIYATNVRARVVSMSLGAMFPKMLDHGPNRLITALNHVTAYARQRGTTIIAAVGNADTDLDGPMTNIPSDGVGVIGVAATAPHDWALNPSGFLDHRALYSNYGRGAVDLSGPGGDVYRQPDESQLCTIGVIADFPCFVFDLVLSTGAPIDGQPIWFWSAGTSMATPHVAGVAALLLGEGNNLSPAQLEQALRTRATDLGVPGNDPFYGGGRTSSGY